MQGGTKLETATLEILIGQGMLSGGGEPVCLECDVVWSTNLACCMPGLRISIFQTVCGTSTFVWTAADALWRLFLFSRYYSVL